MSRKTTINHAAVHCNDCAVHIQNAYKAKNYSVERFVKTQREGCRVSVTFNNATSTGGAIFRAIFGLNACGTLDLRSAGNDLRVKVGGKLWARFIRFVVFLIGIYGWCGCLLDECWFVFWPLSITAIIGSFRQKALLDGLYNDTLGWLATRGVSRSGQSGKGPQDVSGRDAKAEGELEYRCPHCGTNFCVSDDAEGYRVECSGCGKQLDLTELSPLQP
jgi:predicted Zn finger-like uncharacterized protein